MPETNTPQKDKNQDLPLSSSLPPSVLLRFRRPLIVVAHLAAFAASLMLSFLVVQNMQFKREWLELYPALLLFFLLVKLPVFGLFKQYRGWWRYVSISDLHGIVRASLISTCIIVVLWLAAGQAEPVRTYLPADLERPAEGVCIADMFATVLMLAGLRVVIRLYYEASTSADAGRLKRFLIVGAGNAGEALLREIARMPTAQYDVVGFIDDDPIKQGTHIHAIPVLGTVEQLPGICKEHNTEEIAIAMPSASPRQLRRVIQVCEGAKIRFRTVPSITDIASGKLRVSQIRDVDINDLLGREAVQLDLDLIETFARDKTILVTGAGGSIGSEMCRQLCHFQPELLVLVEQAENPLFYMEQELHRHFPAVNVIATVCDITDKARVDELFERYRPQVVIHAAAHKHVPLMELNAGEAVKNNVLGTQIVADAAESCGTTNFVMISTDKAVNPASIMGASKRIAEMYIQDLSRTSGTQFVTVRFGNVLGSDGSVVPIFKKQIAEGGPVTITHPDMKRYFMTIPEASQLVLQAATMGKGGEIFVLDMGEPVKIVDLARELITLSGFRPVMRCTAESAETAEGQLKSEISALSAPSAVNDSAGEIEMIFTGARPGEKLFEELSIEGEDMQRTRHPKIWIADCRLPIADCKKRELKIDIRKSINDLVAIATRYSSSMLDARYSIPVENPASGIENREAEIVRKIKELVPEYSGVDKNSFVFSFTAEATESGKVLPPRTQRP